MMTYRTLYAPFPSMYLLLNWTFVISTLLSSIPLMASATTADSKDQGLTPKQSLQGLIDELEIRNNNNNAVRIILKPNSLEQRSGVRPQALFGTRMTKPEQPPVMVAQARRAAFNSWGGKRSPAAGGRAEEESEDRGVGDGGAESDNMGSPSERRMIPTSGEGESVQETVESGDGIVEEKRGFNSWGGKKRNYDVQVKKRGFNSWGGKRGFDLKRGFNSWGGKRSSSSTDDDALFKEVRRGFNSWGGKREYGLGESAQTSLGGDADGEKRGFNSWGGKRGFNSWGGKRAHDHDDDKQELNKDDAADNGVLNAWTSDPEKRGFNSWGGKRGFNSWGGKRGFNSWGGKRGFNSWGGKRGFNSWGGKRDDAVHTAVHAFDDEGEINELGEKRAFQSWGGKRGDLASLINNKETRGFNSWGGKRLADSAHSEAGEKRGFNSWGGKRSGGIESYLTERKRGFNSWGGKRSGLRAHGVSSHSGEENQSNDDYPTSDSEENVFDDDDMSAIQRKKRSMYDDDVDVPLWLEDRSAPESYSHKRNTFRPWGGKRTPIFLGQGDLLLPVPEVRGNFNAWGGKRADVHAGIKRQFKPWGGKRADGDESMENMTSWNGASRDNRKALLQHILQQFSNGALEESLH